MQESISIQDPAHLFPIFPYIVDEQQLLAVPNYVTAFEAHAKIAIREKLIVKFEYAGQQPYPVIYLTLRDGVMFSLSAMQGCILLMGVLHYHQLDPEERSELNKTLERRVPLTERERNPHHLERPTRLRDSSDPMIGTGEWSTRQEGKRVVNSVLSGIDMSQFDVEFSDDELGDLL